MHKNGTDLIGCRYQISVLRDDFVPRVLDALGKTNIEKVWAKTEKTSTVYRGKRVHVVDCVKACFSHIYDDSLPYITVAAAFSKNSSDDMEKDCHIAEDEVLLNDTKHAFYVLGRMSLFPLGISDYALHIAAMTDLAKKRGVYAGEAYYTHNFEGNVHDMFDFINDVLEYGNANLENYTFDISMTIYGAEGKESVT